MKRSIESLLSPTMYERLKSVRMSEHEREAAITAMVNASLLVDGCAWIAQRIANFGASLFPARAATR
jgi:hypothetical protein